MMDTIVPERKWHLIRNDNGEWISDDRSLNSNRYVYEGKKKTLISTWNGGKLVVL